MGTSAIAGAPGSSPSNNPPNGQQQGGGSDPAGGTGGQQPGAPPQNAGTPGVDRAKLNPLLRGMSEEQLNETFESLFQAIRQPVQQQQAPAPKPPEPEPLTNDGVRDRFDPNSDKFDPIGAVRDITQRNYGPLIEDIGRRANAGLKENLKRQLPDFEKHEKEIDQVLQQYPANQVNEAVIAQTYFAVLGAKEAARIQQERNKPATTVPPSTQKQEVEPTKLSADEEAVARVMFRGAEDPIKAYLDAQKKFEAGYSLKVPESK